MLIGGPKVDCHELRITWGLFLEMKSFSCVARVITSYRFKVSFGCLGERKEGQVRKAMAKGESKGYCRDQSWSGSTVELSLCSAFAC